MRLRSCKVKHTLFVVVVVVVVVVVLVVNGVVVVSGLRDKSDQPRITKFIVELAELQGKTNFICCCCFYVTVIVVAVVVVAVAVVVIVSVLLILLSRMRSAQNHKVHRRIG